MYETLDNKNNDDKDVEGLKNMLKKTIEKVETQLKKLLIHQKKRQEIIKTIEATKKLRQESLKHKRSPTTYTKRGGYYRSRRGSGRYGMSMFNPTGMYHSNPMYWRGGRGGIRYRSIIRKPRAAIRNGFTKTRGRGRGRGARGGTRRINANLSGKSVDYRTSTLIIQDIPDGADEAELRIHFLKFGEVKTIEILFANVASVEFKKRADAEKALINGRQFKNKKIKITFGDGDDIARFKNNNNNENDENDNDINNNIENNTENNDVNQELKVYDDLPQINKDKLQNKEKKDNDDGKDEVNDINVIE